VQFSHSSIREFLTSARLATSSGEVSRYHIDLEHAHTILAQACLGVLLQPGNHDEEDAIRQHSPLLGYAAEHWVTHTQFAGMSPCVRKAMEYLFDPDKPHFTAWLKIHNIDAEPELGTSLFKFKRDHEPASPLYYAALCGFQDLVQHVLDKYPQHLNRHGGRYVTPLVAALARGNFQTVEFLRQNGADVDVLGFDGITPFISASWFGDLDMVQRLLDYKANVNAKTKYNWSALHYVSMRDPLHCRRHSQWFSHIAQLLLQHGADVDARGRGCTTPLHMAVINRRVEVVRVLLEHGANVDAEDDEGKTSSQIAAESRYNEILEVLLEYGAK
jgi:Ankyrin repeats (3 copies)/Ankyrin repeats (many copies)